MNDRIEIIHLEQPTSRGLPPPEIADHGAQVAAPFGIQRSPHWPDIVKQHLARPRRWTRGDFPNLGESKGGPPSTPALLCAFCLLTTEIVIVSLCFTASSSKVQAYDHGHLGSSG